MDTSKPEPGYLLHLVCTDKCGLVFCTGVVRGLRDSGLLGRCRVCVSGGMANVLLYHIALLTRNREDHEDNWFALCAKPCDGDFDVFKSLLWPRIKQFCTANHEWGMTSSCVMNPCGWFGKWVSSSDVFFPDVPEEATLGGMGANATVVMCFTGYSDMLRGGLCMTTDKKCPVGEEDVILVTPSDQYESMNMKEFVCALSMPPDNQFDETAFKNFDLEPRNGMRHDLSMRKLVEGYASIGMSTILLVDGSSGLPHFKRSPLCTQDKMKQYSDGLFVENEEEDDEKRHGVRPSAYMNVSAQIIDPIFSEESDAKQWMDEIFNSETRLEHVVEQTANRLYAWGYLICMRRFVTDPGLHEYCVSTLAQELDQEDHSLIRLVFPIQGHHELPRGEASQVD